MAKVLSVVLFILFIFIYVQVDQFAAEGIDNWPRNRQKIRSRDMFKSVEAPGSRVEKYYAIPEDPLFLHQWNLLNTGQFENKYEGYDLRVEQAWLQGVTGCNVTVTIVDDGVDFQHPDLWPNFAPKVSYDTGEDSDSSNEHGTRCSGIVAAMQDDFTCGVGIAHECNLGSIKLLRNNGSTTDVEEAEALSYARDMIDVYSNSWGVTDSGSDVRGPRTLTKLALEMGTREGRSGKGSIYVWANGNGRDEDDCAADGYASSMYTISVGGIGVDGHSSFFDEPCSSKMVVAYVTDTKEKSAIITTDPGESCKLNFGGTSAATPMVSGAIALALEANPGLTWRDVQYLIVYTANPHLTAGPLTRNGAGLAVSRQYGFGVMDTEAMVTRARHWINVPPQMEHRVTDISEQQIAGVRYSATVDYMGDIQYLEHVVVTISVAVMDGARGHLEIGLTSPSETSSVLLQPRPFDYKPGKYVDWPFMSVMFWGENPTGQWTLNINTNDAINVSRVEFQFYGVSRVPEAVAKIPDKCHSDCKRGCAREGPHYCDSCVNLRNAHTLECIDQCPPGYTKRSGYCYDASKPHKVCISPLKNKGCVAAGYTKCCSNRNCILDQFPFYKCFCDAICYKFDDCCEDIAQLGCLVQNVTETFPYVELGMTPDVETYSVDLEGTSSVNISFPFGTSLEPRVYVLKNGSFLFAHDITEENDYTGVVAPFLMMNKLSSGSVSYEIHQENSSEHILSLVNSIITEHKYSSFNSSWLLIATWKSIQKPGTNLTNTFQGILATDFTSSYSIFTYFCGDLSFSNPGKIGIFHTQDTLSVTHGATYREHPHFIACLNKPSSPWVNVVYEISRSEDVSSGVSLNYVLFIIIAGSAASGLIIVIVLIICCKVLLKSAHRHQRGVIRRVDKAQTNKDATNPRELNATYILGRYPKGQKHQNIYLHNV